MAQRVAEMIYFYDSPSMYVRYFDSEQVVGIILEKNILTGLGTGAEMTLWRSYINLDYSLGKSDIDDKKGIDFNTHGSDNSFILMLIDGGVILLIYILFIIYKSFNKIYIYDNRLAWSFLIIIAMNSMLSKHLITNYVLVFTLGFIYFYAKKRLKMIRSF